MTDDERDKIIRMAWEDRTTFDEIEKKTGLNEAAVIKLMRNEMKPSSFRMWRKRVSGRVTKHRKKFIEEVITAKARGAVSQDIHGDD
ncbi:MAG: TIGR03643 family protein [Akkermansiaceae bacterium]